MGSDADVYLRFDGKWGDATLKGECTDNEHPGADGWIQINSFKFGFGSEAKTSSFTVKGDAELKKLTKQQRAEYDKAKEAHDKEIHKTWGESGPLKFEMCSFTKGADRMSAPLMAICHGGEYKIPKAQVQVVRYGGTGKSFKIPFLELFFKDVRLKSCKLNLTNADRPSEDIEFEYDAVAIHSLWTDNTTGDRRPEEPIRAGWDLKKKVQSLIAGT